jgi:hypothetical protein
MKKITLLLFVFIWMYECKAQCPISEVIAAYNSGADSTARLIDKNSECIRQALQKPGNGKYQTMIDNLYHSSTPWVYHTDTAKEKLFNDFYNTWGKLWPTVRAEKPEKSQNEDFYKAIDALSATDPSFFKEKDDGVPINYIHWLAVQSLNKKFGGPDKVLSLMKSIEKIVDF